MPEGLQELMADVTREVLRFQPENIEEFIADYLEAMLLTRELFHIADLTIEDVLDSSLQIVELLQKDGISLHQAESAVEVIKEEFRSHITDMGEDEPLKELNVVNRLIHECKLTTEQAKLASGIIESAWCHYYQRNKNQVSKINPDIAQHVAVKNTLAIYKKSKASGSKVVSKSKLKAAQIEKERNEAAGKIQAWYRGRKVREEFKEMTQAATKIQAAFKGYKARKELQLVDGKSKEVEVEPKVEINVAEVDKEQEDAAVKIQAAFKCYKARKELQNDVVKSKEVGFHLVEINLPEVDKEQEDAAVKIQAGFKGYKTRKNFKQQMSNDQNFEVIESESKSDENVTEVDKGLEKAATKIQAGFKGYKTRQQLKQQTEPCADNEFWKSSCFEKREKAATVIQSWFRACNIRKVLQIQHKSAAIIQAHFRGFKTRKNIQGMNLKCDFAISERQQ